MILFRPVGLFLLIMAFYSFGAVAGNRTKSMTPERAPSPSFIDVATIILSWLVTLAAYWAGYRAVLVTAIGAGMGLLEGFILHRWRNQSQRDELRAGASRAKSPASRVEPSASVTDTSISDDCLQPYWRVFVRQVGRFQSGLLLFAFYFIAIMPFGIVVGNLGDPLGLKAPPGDSFWKQRGDASQSLEGARRQS